MQINILTANYNSSYYLNRVIEYTYLKNSNIDINWIVVDNSPKPDTIDTRVKVFPGMPDSEYPSEFPGIYRGSYSHSRGLMIGLPHIDMSCRYLLVLDSDFFLATPIEQMLKYLEKKDFAIFGTAYTNIKKQGLIRDFPCVFCCFFDLQKVNIEDLDFRAGWLDKDEAEKYRHIHPDTGWRVAMKFRGGPIRYSYIHSRHRPFEGMCEYYPPPMEGYHLRAKVDSKDRKKEHSRIMKDIIKGKFDE